MKILQVTAVDFTIEKFLLPLIKAQQSEGHVVEIASYCGEIGDRLKKQGYIIHHIPFSRDMNIFHHFVSLIKVMKLLISGQYDCVHTHTPVASLIARLACRLTGVRTVVHTAHGFYFHENMNALAYKVAYWLEKFWSKYFTDFIFFQSSEDYQLARDHRFQKHDRLLHIGNGVDAIKFNPELYDGDYQRELFKISKEHVVLTFVGRLVREKGIVELVEAYKQLKSSHGNIVLLIVGGEVVGDRGSLDEESLRKIVPERMQEDIRFLGLRSEIPDLLSATDIFILPSYREGLPRSIIEAMAMGKPVVATDIRGCREEVYNEQNGYLCNVKDSKDLADKLSMLVGDPEKMKRFGKNSRVIFLNQFDEKVVIDKQLEVFRKISGEI